MDQKANIEYRFFGWLLILWGGLSALLGYFSSMITIHYMGRQSPYSPHVDILISLLNGLPYGFILSVIGYGLLKYKTWARKCVLYLLVPFFVVVQPIRYFYILGFWFDLKMGVANFLQSINIYKICPIILPVIFGWFLLRHFRYSDTDIRSSVKILWDLIIAFIAGAISEIFFGILNVVIFPILSVRISGILSLSVFGIVFYLLLVRRSGNRKFEGHVRNPNIF